MRMLLIFGPLTCFSDTRTHRHATACAVLSELRRWTESIKPAIIFMAGDLRQTSQCCSVSCTGFVTFTGGIRQNQASAIQAYMIINWNPWCQVRTCDSHWDLPELKRGRLSCLISLFGSVISSDMPFSQLYSLVTPHILLLTYYRVRPFFASHLKVWIEGLFLGEKWQIRHFLPSPISL